MVLQNYQNVIEMTSNTIYIILGIPLRGLLSSYVNSYIVSYTVTSEAVSFLPEVVDQI